MQLAGQRLSIDVPPLADDAARAATKRQQQLTKPRGSLGRLEELVAELARCQDNARPASRPAAALLFAADHPVARHGVSAYPQEVTAAMVQNFASGGAAASVLARQLGVLLRVIDVGVAHPYTVPQDSPVAVFRDPVASLAAGDLRVVDAMSETLAEAALRAGSAAVDRIPAEVRLLILGEMGIGNTTVAAAIGAALLRVPPATIVGPGTGVDGDGRGRKVAVVQDALARMGSWTDDPWAVLAGLGGREIAAMIGAAARAIEQRIVVLVDGFIVTAAMLLLCRLCPAARPWLVFAHRSQEPGHALLLDALHAEPLLDLGLCLGEGSGALLALPVLDQACALHREMATFASAGVPDQPAAPRSR